MSNELATIQPAPKASDQWRRGDRHPTKAGLFYWGISGKSSRLPVWVRADQLASYRKNQKRLTAQWQKNNPTKHRACQRRFREKHGKRRNEEAREYRNNWKKMKRATDPLYALKSKCSDRLRVFLKRAGWRKRESVHPMLGCTYSQLRAHLESRFKPGMTWLNAGYHGWHIDHKIPLASARTKKDVRRLFHYTNLQPLWQKENFSKGSKIAA